VIYAKEKINNKLYITVAYIIIIIVPFIFGLFILSKILLSLGIMKLISNNTAIIKEEKIMEK
jgi:hypothetical protein